MNKVMFLLELTLFISIFIIFYQILKSIKINKIEKRIGVLLDLGNKKFIEETAKEYEKDYFGNDKKSFREKVNRMIDVSGIRERFKFFIPEIFYSVSVLFMFLGFFIIRILVKDNILLQIEGGIFGLVLPFYILLSKKNEVENVINDEVLSFIDEGLAASKENKELLYILEECTLYGEGKVNNLIKNIIDKLKSGLEEDAVFKDAIESIDNIRLKEILQRLNKASKEDSKYFEVFEDAYKTNENYFKIRSDADSKIREQIRGLLVNIVLICCIGVVIMFSIPNAKEFISQNILGKIVIAYFGGLTIITIYRMIKFNEFNY